MLRKFVELLSTMHYNPNSREINTIFNLTTLKMGEGGITTVYANFVTDCSFSQNVK